ncbi:hypothetical protein [Glutamicibacter sp. JC586]|uniref:hypothetical protein n=1 Tax=Glutamicibacter sp. JC586 TaxID=2590552 RepID=UPI00135CF6D6|nr:hypothetical protein [Glutamicibacter sp. JC586]
MKLVKSMVPVAAIVSLAAGLFGASPAQAAVKLPAGCTTQYSPRNNSEVFSLECKTLAKSATFAQYENLQSLIIGPKNSGEKSKVAITSIPKLPAGLTYLSINAPKVQSYAPVGQIKNLTVLNLGNGSSGLSMSTLAKASPKLTYLAIMNAAPIDYSPLGKLKQLQSVYVSGDLPSQKTVENQWTKAKYPVALNGSLVLPVNNDQVDERGRKIGKEYSYDAQSRKLRWNGCWKGRDYVKFAPKNPATKEQPQLKSAGIYFNGPIEVSCLSEWAKDSKAKLQIMGKPQIGKTVTAKLSHSKDYIDTYQWTRSGKPIRGATNASYKLVKADLGKQISVTATDKIDTFGFTGGSFPKTVPYSVTKVATKKALYGFTTKKPTTSGQAKVGKKLTAKTAKWGGSPTRYAYQWLRNGKNIGGATKSSYKLVQADRNKKISVRMTGSKKNYQNASATSGTVTVR